MGPRTVTGAFGSLGAPPDPIAWFAFALAMIALFSALLRAAPKVPGPSVAVPVLAALAFILSLGYTLYYLRGGPRIIDATSYYLEARSFAAGDFAFAVPEPAGSFRGRFLVDASDGRALGVIFPPGYPAVLALGFWVGAPMLVGPLIGAALVVSTYGLVRRLFGRDEVALLAAMLSVLSGVLRYHTADTMSHGWAALLLCTSLWLALNERWVAQLLAGACCGWLIATRPVTGAIATALVGAIAVRSPRALIAFALGIVPGLALLLVHQRAITGAWLTSTQLAYYSAADGPPGCFRYGFGAGIGCRVEHGDFVRAHLEDGFGLVAALGTTLRRLKMHLPDAANAEPFFVLLIVAFVAGRRERGMRLIGFGIAGVVLGYAPFYFDGNYPGGGARFYADVLPLEHAALAWGLARWRLERWALPVALLGFAVHTSFDHRALAEREGGRPMFEEEMVRRGSIERGLLFVDTDHGFNLGHKPGAIAATSLVVARHRGDAHDFLLWHSLGRPPAYRYRFIAGAALSRGLPDRFEPTRGSPIARATPLLEPFSPPESLSFEAEAAWPPSRMTGGWVRPEYPPCASQRRALAFEQDGGLAAPRASFVVVAPKPGEYRVHTGWFSAGAGQTSVDAIVEIRGKRLEIRSDKRGCQELPGPTVFLVGGAHQVAVTARRPGLALDYVRLESLE